MELFLWLRSYYRVLNASLVRLLQFRANKATLRCSRLLTFLYPTRLVARGQSPLYRLGTAAFLRVPAASRKCGALVSHIQDWGTYLDTPF